jgi:hypothetical protein
MQVRENHGDFERLRAAGTASEAAFPTKQPALHQFVTARAAPRHFANLAPVGFEAHVLCDGGHVRCGITDNGFFFRFGLT